MLLSLRAVSTFTFVQSQPKDAPGMVLVAMRCCVVFSPTSSFPMRLQTGMADSIRCVSVVPRRRAVKST